MDKAYLRKKLKKEYEELSPEYMKEPDSLILRAILGLDEYRQAQNIFSYLSVKNEIDTRGIIEYAEKDSKRIYLPRVYKKGIMKAALYTGDTELVRGSMDIPQPDESAQELRETPEDIAIVPALAYNREGYRLGHGGGYYDRFLADFKGISIGICRERFVLDCIPVMTHDVPVDILISESGIIMR